MTSTHTDINSNQPQKTVGAALGIAIFLVPIIFAWVTLRSGYSTKARVISFGWLILSIILLAGSDGDNKQVDKDNPETLAQPAAATAPLAEQPHSEEETPTFDLTIDEFISRLEQSYKTLENPVSVSIDSETENDELTILALNIGSEHTAYNVSADKESRKVSSVMVFGVSKDKPQGAVSILYSVIAAGMSIEDPLMPVADRRGIPEGIGLLSDPIPSKSTFARGGIDYNMSISESVGMILILTPSK